MKRRFLGILLHLIAGVSLALCVATVVAWERGGWVQKQFNTIGKKWWYSTDCDSRRDLIQLVIVHAWPAPAIGPSIKTTGPAADAWINQPWTFRLEAGGFAMHYWVELGSNGRNWIMEGRRLGLDAPFEGVILLLLVLPTLVWVLLPIRRLGIRSIKRKVESRAESAAVLDDLPCVHCGYNLRTQNSTSQCTECGSPVSDSLAINIDLRKSPQGWLRRLMAGAVLLFGAKMMLAATLALSFQRNGGFVREYLPALWCAAMVILLFGAGAFLVTAPEFPRVQTYKRKNAVRLRKLAAASLACLVGGICYQVIGTARAPRPLGLMGSPSVQWYWPALSLFLVGWVFYCCCLFVEFRLFAELAKRMGDHLLARFCALAGIGATSSSVLLLFGAKSIVEQWSTFGIFAVGGLMVVWLLFLLWTGFLNLDFAVRLWEQTSLAKERDARQFSAIEN